MNGSRPPWAGIGVSVPSCDAYGIGHPVLEVARAAEQAGLDHVWVPDHLVFRRPITEALTTLAMIAGATKDVRVGSAVLNPAIRPLTWLAKEVATIAALAPERLMLGVGMGGDYEPEFIAAGMPVKRRARRLDEALDLLPRLLRGQPVEHTGGEQNVSIEGIAPVPAVAPPILVGGRSEPALRRTARAADAWFPIWMDPSRIADRLEELARYAAEAGREHPPGAVLFAYVNVCDDDATGHNEAARLIKRQYGMDYDKVRRWTLVGDETAVAERLADYRAAGVEGFSLAIASPDQRAQVDRLAGVRALLDTTTFVPSHPRASAR